jgi:hypothetical protein
MKAGIRSWLIAALAAIALAGCASVHATTTVHTVATRPASGQDSQAKALALARRLVAKVHVPPGTKPVHLRFLPPSLDDPQAPSGRGWASDTRILIAPGNAIAVVDALLARAPFGDGTVGVVPVTVSTQLESPELGVDAAVVDVSAMQYSRTTTLLAIRAFAAWLPLRTAAEHLDPARIRAVTVTEVDNKYPARRQVTRTLASRAVIARLATFLNHLRPAVFGIAPDCPMPRASSTLKFTPATGNGNTVVVSTFGCGFDQVTVNGAAQPALSDPYDRLLALSRELTASHGSR